MKKTLLLLLIFSFLQINAQCWKTISAGNNHNIALKPDGTLWGWGNNTNGQIGDGTTTSRNIPVKIGTANNWKTITAGWGHTVALKTDGSLWAWGYGILGQIGNGSGAVKAYNPVQQVGTAKDWQTIAAGPQFTIAIKTDGTLWAWGYNEFGQLGDGTTVDKNTPTQIGSDKDWETIATGSNHTIALKKDGSLWTWGENKNGKLGDGTIVSKIVPTQIGTATNWKAIAGGLNHTAAIKTDGTLWCWGFNANGSLGDGTNTDKLIPTQIGTETNWKTIAVGWDNTVALKTDGSLWSWGYNANGKLGIGTTTNTFTPTQVGTSKDWLMGVSGYSHEAGLKADGAIWTWGQNTTNQLGDGTSISKSVPTLVSCPALLTLTTSQANITCFGLNNGSASITEVSGGTGPYTYLWSNGKTTSSITGLAAGEYSCTVKDAGSLAITKTFLIAQPTLLYANVTSTNVSCNNNDGILTVAASGGTLPYQYSILSGTFQNSNIFSGLPSGDYIVNVRDNSGCFYTINIIINPNNTPPSAPNSQTFNNTATVANLKAYGINVKWYSVPVGGTTLSLSTLIQTGKYYVSQTIDGCESLRATVDVVIVPPLANGELPTNGLVAYYPFSGNANDNSGNKSNASVAGAVLTTDRFGNSDSAYSFNGTDSFVNAVIPNIPQGNSSRTISGWFKTDNVFSDPKKMETCIFNYGALEKSQRLSLYIYSKGYLEPITGSDFSNDDFYVDNYNYANNDWYFFTLTYNGTKLSLYVNGKFVSEKAVALNTTNNIFRLGERMPDNKNEWFKGTIDDVAIWNRVLSPEEISALYVPENTTSFTAIPDPNFEKKLIDLGIDSGDIDGKVLTSNIASVKTLDVSSSSISNLSGIEDFKNLDVLSFNSNLITNVDLSKNNKLFLFYGRDNKLTSINLPEKNQLYEIYLDRNNLADLDVSKCDSLRNLSAEDNQIKSINLARNKDLATLFLDRNKLTVLDISKNTVLKTVWCGENQLSSVVLPESNNLDVLYLNANNFTALDISKYTTLKEFVCSTNQLTEIDISNNKALTYFHCQENKLTNIDVSNNIALASFYCYKNELKSINLSQNKALTTLWCHTNKLASLDVSKNTNLTKLSSYGNNFISVNVKNGNNKNLNIYTQGFTNNPALTCIQVDDVAYSNANWGDKKDVTATYNSLCTSPYTLIPDINFENKLISQGLDSGIPDGKVLTANIASVTNLDVYNSSIRDLTGIEGFASLEVLNCGKNQITSLDLSKSSKLKQLECYNNKLINLDVSANPNLWYLDCFTNKITTLDLSKNKLLETVYCFDNVLTSLNVSNLKKLKSLDCPDNQLTNLDVSTNTALEELHCYKNKLQSLDVSKNLLLVDVVCYSNELTYLNLKNGNNKHFAVEQYKTIFTNNPNLKCIEVDDVNYSNTNWSTRKDETANYSVDCSISFVAIPDQNFEQKLIDLGIDKDGLNGSTTANLNLITSLELSGSNIANLSGIENFTSLTYLDVSNNQLKTLDIRNNVLLETLNASSNQLTTLDVSKNNKLTIVYVANNPLISLNLRNGNNRNFIIQKQTGKKSAAPLYTTFLGLTTLTCIQVDDAAYSNANWSAIKESNTTYSNTCKNLGVEDVVLTKATIYPNPTIGEVNILNITLEKATVYNELGQLVKTFTLNSNNTSNTINLSGLPRGVYYIYLINQDAASAKKVIVE